jgi:hypothetical protein
VSKLGFGDWRDSSAAAVEEVGGGGRGVEGVEEDSDEGRKLRWRKKKGGA